MRKGTVGLLTLFFLWVTAQCRADIPAEVIRQGKRATALVQSDVAEGTAFCIAASGLFVTNQHVIADAANKNKLTLVLNAGEATQRIVQASVVREDKQADLALLQTVEKDGFTPLQQGDAESLVETQSVIAFGYPFGSDLAVGKAQFPPISVNVGRITALRREGGSLREIQLDAALNPGNSGGPLLNEKGQVVGIVHSGVRGAGVNFAIPVVRLREFLRRTRAALHAPLLTSGNQRLLQTFEIELLTTPKPGAMVAVTLLLTAPGQTTREFAAKPLGGSRYSVQAVPFPVSTDVATVHIAATNSSGSKSDFNVKNHIVTVGERTCKLSEIAKIIRGNSPYVLLADGQKLRGAVSGLLALEAVGNGAHVNLSEYTSIQVLPAASDGKEVGYRIVAREDEQVICDVSGALVIDSPTQEGADTNNAAAQETTPLPGVPPAFPGLAPRPLVPIAGHSGLLIVSSDEWPTSDTGFRETFGSTVQFIQNLAMLMAGGKGGRFLIYSNHWTFGEPFQRVLYQLGYQFNVSMTPGSLSAYKGVFVGGTPGVDRAALMTYLQRGGNVYIAGSTGMPDEMSFWNAMLKPYGMEYINHPQNGPVAETVPIHTFARTPLFEGVGELHLRGPNPIRVIPGYERQVQVLSEEDGYNWWTLATIPRVAGFADVTVPPPAEAAQGGRRVYNWANGHWYEAVSKEGGCTWAEAYADAQTKSHRGLRGHLATITSAQESLFIIDHFPEALRGSYFLGGYQDRHAPDYREPDGGWRWITGEFWQFTNWHGNGLEQPDNGKTVGGPEDYLQFTGSGGWNDCDLKTRASGYMVEFEPTSGK